MLALNIDSEAKIENNILSICHNTLLYLKLLKVKMKLKR